MKRNVWGCLVLGMAAFGFAYAYINRAVIQGEREYWKRPSQDFVNEMAQGYRFKFGTWPANRDEVQKKLTTEERDFLPTQYWPVTWMLVSKTGKSATYLLSFPPQWDGGTAIVKVDYDKALAEGFSRDFEKPKD